MDSSFKYKLPTEEGRKKCECLMDKGGFLWKSFRAIFKCLNPILECCKYAISVTVASLCFSSRFLWY